MAIQFSGDERPWVVFGVPLLDDCHTHEPRKKNVKKYRRLSIEFLVWYWVLSHEVYSFVSEKVPRVHCFTTSIIYDNKDLWNDLRSKCNILGWHWRRSFNFDSTPTTNVWKKILWNGTTHGTLHNVENGKLNVHENAFSLFLSCLLKEGRPLVSLSV
jgi:hypothetical protein